jgi:hypothetical protein
MFPSKQSGGPMGLPYRSSIADLRDKPVCRPSERDCFAGKAAMSPHTVAFALGRARASSAAVQLASGLASEPTPLSGTGPATGRHTALPISILPMLLVTRPQQSLK